MGFSNFDSYIDPNYILLYSKYQTFAFDNNVLDRIESKNNNFYNIIRLYNAIVSQFKDYLNYQINIFIDQRFKTSINFRLVSLCNLYENLDSVMSKYFVDILSCDIDFIFEYLIDNILENHTEFRMNYDVADLAKNRINVMYKKFIEYFYVEKNMEPEQLFNKMRKYIDRNYSNILLYNRSSLMIYKPNKITNLDNIINITQQKLSEKSIQNYKMVSEIHNILDILYQFYYYHYIVCDTNRVSAKILDQIWEDDILDYILENYKKNNFNLHSFIIMRIFDLTYIQISIDDFINLNYYEQILEINKLFRKYFKHFPYIKIIQNNLILNEENKKLKVNNTQLTNVCKNYANMFDVLTDKYNNLNKKYLESQEMYHKLTEVENSNIKRIEDLEKENNDLKTNTHNSKFNNKIKSFDIFKLVKFSIAKNQQIEELQNKIKELHNDNEELQKVIKELHNDNEDFEKKHNIFENTIFKLNEQIKELQKGIKELHNDNGDFEEEYNMLENTFFKLNKQIKELQLQNEEWSRIKPEIVSNGDIFDAEFRIHVTNAVDYVKLMDFLNGANSENELIGEYESRIIRTTQENLYYSMFTLGQIDINNIMIKLCEQINKIIKVSENKYVNIKNLNIHISNLLMETKDKQYIKEIIKICEMFNINITEEQLINMLDTELCKQLEYCYNTYIFI